MVNGIYKLTADVTNPTPDLRRKFDFWSRPTFLKGSVLKVWGLDRGDGTVLPSVVPVGVRYGRSLAVEAPAARAALAAAEPYDPDLDTILALAEDGPANITPRLILAQLVQDGAVTLGQVAAAANRAVEQQ